MNEKKISKMHGQHGKIEGKICKDCPNLKRYTHHYTRKKYRKCEAYGVTSSIASDWAEKYPACGLHGEDIHQIAGYVTFVESEKTKTIEGQLSLI